MSDTRLSVIAELKVQGFQKNLGKMQASLNKFQNSSLTKTAAGLAKVSAAFTAMGLVAVKAAADIETLETSLVSLTGGTREAAKAMQDLQNFTASTPFQLEGVAKAFRQLVASGSTTQEATQQLQFLGDIAATTGARIEDIAAIFSKVNAKGKVELENLNQLAERGIPIFEALAEATGLPADKLGAGAVSVAQFNETIAAFAQEGGFAEGAMSRLAETTAGKFSTAMDNVKLATAAAGDSLKPLADSILELTINISQYLQDNPRFAAAIGKLIGFAAGVTALAGAFTGLTAAIAFLGPALLPIAGIAAAIATIVGIVDSATDVFVDYTDANEEMADVVAETNRVIAQQTIANKQALASFKTLREEYEAAIPGSEKQRSLAQDLTSLHDDLAQFYNAETGEVTDLTAAQDTLNGSLARQLQVLKDTTRQKLLQSKLQVLESQRTSKLADLFKDFPRLEVDDIEIGENGELQLDETGADRVNFRFSARDMRDLRRRVKEYNLLSTAITKVADAIEAEAGTPTPEFDSSEYRNAFDEIRNRYKGLQADLARDNAEGVISEEDYLKDKTKLNEDYAKDLKALYTPLRDELDGLLQQQEAGTLNQTGINRLRFLVGFVPEVQEKIVDLLKSAGTTATEEVESLEEAIQRLADIKLDQDLTIQAKAEVIGDLGLEGIDLSTLSDETRKLVEDATKAAKEVLKQGGSDVIGIDSPLVIDRNEKKDRARVQVAQELAEGIRQIQQELLSVDGATPENLERYFTALRNFENVTEDASSFVADLITQAEKAGLETGDLVGQLFRLGSFGGVADLLSRSTEDFTSKLLKAAPAVDATTEAFDRGLTSVETLNAALADEYFSSYVDKIKLAQAAIASGDKGAAAAGESFLKANATIVDYITNLEKAGSISPELRDTLLSFVPAVQAQEAAFAQLATGITGFFNTLISDVASGTAKLTEILEAAIKKILIQVAALIAAYTVLFFLTGGASTGSGGFLKGLIGKEGFLAKGLGIDAFFAEGGAVFGPTLAMIGEKPGSRGEAVVPFEKIGQFVNMVGGGTSEGPVEVYGKLRGRDIELSGRRGGKQRNNRH